MASNFDIKKVKVVTAEDLKQLLASLKKMPLPDLKRTAVIHDYICGQMRLVHEFFNEKIGHQTPTIAHVTTWAQGTGFLDHDSPEWAAVKKHMISVVDMSESCSILLLALSKRKASDVSYGWTSGSVRSGHPYLYTATNNTPDDISARDPFVVFYGTEH